MFFCNMMYAFLSKLKNCITTLVGLAVLVTDQNMHVVSTNF